MIIFLEDWTKKEAYIQTNTKNKSFLHYAGVLQSMGIRNHLWPLQVYDRRLLEIDAQSPNLTLEECGIITAECKRNLIYFLREVCLITQPGMKDPVHFIANRGNMAMMWLYANHVTTMVEMIRQTGKSIGADSLKAWLAGIALTNAEINLLTKDDSLRSKNMQAIKDILKDLPYYVRFISNRDVANSEIIKISKLDNIIRCHLPSASPKTAIKVGRGFTSANNFIDEIAFILNIEISLPAMLASGTNARRVHEANNLPFGTVFTTTAGMIDDRDGGYAYKLKTEAAPFTEAMFDCQNQEELYKVIRKASRNDDLTVSCVFNHRQLGKTDEWLIETIKENKVFGDDANRDFFGIWTSGTLRSPFPVEITKKIRDSKVADYYTEIDHETGYSIRWYVPKEHISNFMNNNVTVLAVDTSDAIGKDDNSGIIRDIKTGGVVAAFNINETSNYTFAKWLAKLIIKYNNMRTIIERKATGSVIIDIIIETLVANEIDPFVMLFNRIVNESEKYTKEYEIISKPLYLRPYAHIDYKKYFGFATSGKGYAAREGLYGTTLQLAAKFTGDTARDGVLIDQLLGLVEKNNRIDHSASGHDDSVVSWLLSYWLLTNGRNLTHYGIQPNTVLSANSTIQKDNTPTNVYTRSEQAIIRKEIVDYANLLKNTRDPFLVYRYEMKLKALAARLVLQPEDTFSLDALLKMIRESKN